jgi:ABC-type nitrate/sulfonate/bicarbonate transport system substrate-binding protein
MLFRAAYNLPVTAGLAQGFFAKHGLEIELRYTRGSQMLSDELRAGRCDLGVLSADDVVYEVETHRADLFMFMGFHAGILRLMARPGIRTARDLAAGRLGVDDPASGFALVAHKILTTLGLPRDRYDTLSVGGHELRARALQDGKIDAALLTPPFTLELLARGFASLASARDHVPTYQASAGVTTRRWASEHPGALVAYIRAYRDGLKWTLDPANREAAIAQLAAEFGLRQELAAPTYEALVDPTDGLFPDAVLDIAGIRTVLDLRVEAGLLPAPPPDPSRYYDLGYFRRAQELDH